MRTASQLPESLKDFAYRNAVQVDTGKELRRKYVTIDPRN
jgi:hypothetical protein